jgi:hypothetical protein
MARVVIYYVLVLGNRSLTTVTVKKKNKKPQTLIISSRGAKTCRGFRCRHWAASKVSHLPTTAHTLFLFFSLLSLSLFYYYYYLSEFGKKFSVSGRRTRVD